MYVNYKLSDSHNQQCTCYFIMCKSMASLLSSLTILHGGRNVNMNSASMHNQDTKKIHYATGKDQEIHIIL